MGYQFPTAHILNFNMKFTIIALAVLVAPQLIQGSPQIHESSEEEENPIPILRDDRVQGEDGRFNVEVETGNGIRFSQGGSPEGLNGAVIQAGEYSYIAPDGTPIVVKFVANENGYQPESDQLPVAPEFPHPIPQFVLDQIAFAAAQEAVNDDSNEA